MKKCTGYKVLLFLLLFCMKVEKILLMTELGLLTSRKYEIVLLQMHRENSFGNFVSNTIPFCIF